MLCCYLSQVVSLCVIAQPPVLFYRQIGDIFLLADSKPRHFMFPPFPLLSFLHLLSLTPFVISLCFFFSFFFNYFKLHRSPLKQLQHYPVGRLQLFNFLNLLLLTSVTTLITMMLSTYELVFFVAFYIYLFSWL